MIKKKIILIPLVLGLTGSVIQSKAYFEQLSLDDIQSVKKLDMDFDNNTAFNKINDKIYLPSQNTAKYVSSLKGNAFEGNNSKINIPFSDLGLSEQNNIITVSFIFKWEGNDTTFFPISINGNGSNNIWIRNGLIGFNTGNSEIYGKTGAIEQNKYYSIVAEFNLGDVSKNKLYIDGVKQNLSYVYGTSSRVTTWDANSSFTIGGYASSNTYNIKDKSIIDEVKLFTKSLSQQEVTDVTNSHKTPQLQSELVNNTYTKLDWATEILPENVFWQVGYETNEQPNIDLIYNSNNGLGDGGQSFDSNMVYTGNYSLYTPKTRPDKGNWVLYPYTTPSVQNHVYYWGNTITFKNNDKISISYRVKTNNKASLRILADWKFEKKFTYYNVTTTATVKKGSKVIPVSDASGFKFGMRVAFDKDPNVIEENLQKNIDYATTTDNTITLTAGVPYDIPAGTQLYYREALWAFDDSTKNINPSSEWQLINFNTGISQSEYIDWSEYALNLRQGWATYGDVYLDDLKVGYATKVRLYRNNTKVYEGYESTFDDTKAIDVLAPNSVNTSLINATMDLVNDSTSQRKMIFTFEPVSDNGNLYNYQISSIDNNGVESPKSETISQTITSGVNGYSYVIDKSATTTPDNTVDITSTTIEKNITDTGVYYLHIKAIDNNANASSTVHYKIDIPTIIANANPSNNNIRLNWTMNDLNNKTFKVYQKKPGSSSFQSISATNLNNSKQVKVLNIHPNGGTNITFTTWDGETLTLPKSASLKQWMEEPNAENTKGWGKGLIEVTPVTIDEFNVNPDTYLKDSNGNYKYDVIMIGTWDSNNSKDLNQISLNAVKDFVNTGKGLLAGHDTLRQGTFPYLNELRSYVNIETPGDKNIGSSYQNVKYSVVSKDILKKKEGLLTNYPWVIDKTQLTVPTTHSSRQWAYGDVWFDFTNIDSTLYAGYEGIIYNGLDGRGTNNFYLTTWNNTAMIQTGHSSGQATVDEQKILANTLFYLNQLSTDNFLDDNSGQDVTIPNKPVITGHSFTSRGKVGVNFSSVIDNGSTYSYYVQAEDKSGHNITLSNVVTETINSGIKGYSYIVDSNATTIPDDSVELSKPEAINVNIADNSPKYVHIKAIDNVGNASETYHYKITETTKPIMNITGNPTSWTNEDVALKITADDLDSGIDYIILPNGNMVAGENATYIVTSNGNYTFKSVDKMGNITTQTIVVNKIDKTSPNLTYSKVINSNKTSANINLLFSDTLSGLKYLELPNGTQVNNVTSYTFTAIENGIYPFTVYDNVGNKSTVSIEVFELNTNIYPSTVSRIEYKLSGATVKDWTNYTGAFYITNEGITTITSRSYDKAGNVSIEKTSIVKIDKTKPNNDSILINLK